MPVENGRFVGGPAAVLTLTREQTAALKAAGKENQIILVLADGQRRRLNRAAGVAPMSLLIYNTLKGENDCPREVDPRGLWFAEDKVEVPHEYIVGGRDPVLNRGSSVAGTIVMLSFGATAVIGLAMLMRLHRAH